MRRRFLKRQHHLNRSPTELIVSPHPSSLCRCSVLMTGLLIRSVTHPRKWESALKSYIQSVAKHCHFCLLDLTQTCPLLSIPRWCYQIPGECNKVDCRKRGWMIFWERWKEREFSSFHKTPCVLTINTCILPKNAWASTLCNWGILANIEGY